MLRGRTRTPRYTHNGMASKKSTIATEMTVSAKANGDSATAWHYFRGALTFASASALSALRFIAGR